MTSYNVHSHIFTMANAPQKFLQMYLPAPIANVIDAITDTQAGAAVFSRLLGTLGGNGGKRYASFLSIGKSRSQLDVFEHLMQQYDDPDIKFVALTMNMEYCGAGPSLSGFEGQLEEILEVKRRYPDRLLIFMGIDPRWKTNGDELQKTVQAYFDTKLVINATRSVYPFAGLKLYPSTGFYPFDAKLKETFMWAAANGVPVLSHCYYLGGIYQNDENALTRNLNPPNVYNDNEIYSKPAYIGGFNLLKWLLGRNRGNNNLNTCSYFLEPAACEDMINYFDGNPDGPLKYCFAHYGGADQMLIATGKQSPKKYEDPPYGVAGKNWYEQIRGLMVEYPKCTRTDIAFSLYDPAIFPIVFNDLQTKEYSDKIMFGTDYFLTETEQPEMTTYHQFRQAAAQVNPVTKQDYWQQIAFENTTAFLTSKYYP
jgi:predicted TIM-barrel fold metal-dependent hydrolase